MDDDFVLLSGSANSILSRSIAVYLDHELCGGETLRFSEVNLFVRVPDGNVGAPVRHGQCGI